VIVLKDQGVIVRWVGVPNPERCAETGRYFLPRCEEEEGCAARPPYVVLITEAVLSDVRIVKTVRLCDFHAEEVQKMGRLSIMEIEEEEEVAAELLPPRCWERGCIHFNGAVQPDGTEDGEFIACDAFPDSPGIPDEIAYGEDLHLSSVEGDHGIVFEPDPAREEDRDKSGDKA